MSAVLIAPAYLGSDSVLSMSSCESMFWMACLVALLDVQRRLGLAPQPGGAAMSSIGEFPYDRHEAKEDISRRTTVVPWVLFGAFAGLGLLNKPSVAFFLVALGVSLLATRVGRALLLRKEALIGIALMVVIALPYLLWQTRNQWPLLEFLHNVKVQRKNVTMGPLDFFIEQIIALDPLNGLIWLPGLVYLLRRGLTAYLGVTYLLFLALMILFSAKSYYAQPIYPILFAAGGLAWERLLSRRLRVTKDYAFAFPAATVLLVISSLVTLPISLPIFTPKTWMLYAAATDLYVPSEEGPQAGPLQQFYAARVGWQEDADQVKKLVAGLSSEDRGKVFILCDNYAEAGALQFLAPGLPHVISGHNTYWLWGPGNATGEVMILITGQTLEELQRDYEQITIAGTMDVSGFQVPSERRKRIYLARRRHRSLQADWASFKSYI